MKFLSIIHHNIKDNPTKTLGITILLIIAIQLIPVFIGFELCDSGFYMTFYDNIFKAPDSVEYNFMFYLCGIVGGTFMNLFPNTGLFEIRLLGLANNVLTLYLLYCLFRKHISMTAITIGILLVTISYVAMPMAFYHDLLTCLLYVLSILCLLNGLNRNRNLYLISSGIIIGLNTFVRIPNVLDYSIILLILLYTIYYKKAVRFCVVKCILFTLSFIAGISAVIILMKSLGHYEYFINNLRDLFLIAKDDSGANTHGLSSMIFAQISIYYSVFKFGIKIALPYALLILSVKYIRNKFLLIPIQAAAFGMLAVLFYIDNAVITLCTFSIIGLLGNIILNRDKYIKILSWAGLSMILIVPLGSDGGMYNNGSVIYWIAMPMAISFYSTLKEGLIPSLPLLYIKKTLLTTLITYICVCGIKITYDGVYFDGGLLLEKRYAIRNDRTQHVYTSRERAEIINELLTGIKPFIKKDDYLFACGSLPAINYMTRTKPFIGCCWPEMLSAPLLKHKLDHFNGMLPIILKQKFNSIGKYFGKPSETEMSFREDKKDEIVNEFIEKNNYKVVFENRYFVLLMPK